MSTKNYNLDFQNKNIQLQEILDEINNLPEAGSGGIDTSDATASAGDILKDKTAYVDGQKITGTIETVNQATPAISVNSNGLITATATQTAGYVAAGTKTATSQLAFQAAKTITPGTTNQTAVSSGYYTGGNIIVKGDANLKASNIKSGTSIFGVAGSYEGDANTSDATAKAEDIMAGETAYISTGKTTGTFTIQEEINDINSQILNIKNALNGKTGGGDIVLPVTKKDVNFYDYDGTLLYSYTVGEAQILTELPPLPSSPGLICQGWNYDLATIKSYNRAVDIGAMYITDDGKTRLYIQLVAESRMTVPLYFSQTVSEGVVIDWGDDSATETISGTGNKNTSHTYSSIGEYVIKLEVTSGILGLGNGSATYCVMGNTAETSNMKYLNMLQRVEIGNNVTSIKYAFYNCCSLSNITLSNNVTSTDYAFNGCYSLSNVIIPDSVTVIGTSTFEDCYSLSNVIMPNSVTVIKDHSFYYCHALNNIIISNSVTTISNYAFCNCYSFNNIIVPNGVTTLSDRMFSGCYSLKNIIIPNGVTTISSSAFEKCYSLKNIIIPNSVTTISSYAFYFCYGTAIYDFSSHTSIPTLSSTNAFVGIPSDCIIKVPAALYDSWKAATNWATYADYIVAV